MDASNYGFLLVNSGESPTLDAEIVSKLKICGTWVESLSG